MMVDKMISITQPTDGFVEFKRSFVVQGFFEDIEVSDDSLLRINLLKDNRIVRFVENSKNQQFPLYYKDLIAYPEDMDEGREKLKQFGFPELIVKDINNVDDSLRDATIKCFYDDKSFKAIIISGSDTSHGTIFDDGMNYYDENKNPYSLLDMGDYTIEVILDSNGKKYIETKKITIGRRKDQLICRFNPLSHRDRMVKWCNDNNYSIISDILPGYLDTYLGTWLYHMGLLKMCRANDICLFDDVNVRMFVYLVDETSTSYETELAYLQSSNKIDERFHAYHYTLGEDSVKGIKSEIVEFKDDILYVCRVDKIKDINENRYYIDESNIIETYPDLNNICVDKYSNIAIMGVIKPWKMNSEDFILKDDNTYEIKNKPEIIRYIINGEVIDRKANMERIDKQSIGKSVFEFYNNFTVEDKDLDISIELYDSHMNLIDTRKVMINVK